MYILFDDNKWVSSCSMQLSRQLMCIQFMLRSDLDRMPENLLNSFIQQAFCLFSCPLASHAHPGKLIFLVRVKDAAPLTVCVRVCVFLDVLALREPSQ